MSEGVLDAGLGPTAAIITIGDEIVEGRVLNENATWLSDELMTLGCLTAAVASPVSGCEMRTCCPGYQPRCDRCSAR